MLLSLTSKSAPATQKRAVAAPQALPSNSSRNETVPSQSAKEMTRRSGFVALGSSTLLAGLSGVSQAECEYQTAANGIRWCDIEEGTGDSPQSGTNISANYEGKLMNGKKFDSSFDRKRPFRFQVGVGRVIKGWDVGILGTDDIPPMKYGGSRQLIIPPELGYGKNGAGGVIPPNAPLDFLIELPMPKK